MTQSQQNPETTQLRQDSRFLRACLREETDATPIWLMRQAGRYMSEYRDLRKDYGILDLIQTPELAMEVTMQPINAFDLDAAIIFADILPPLVGMGMDLEFIKGEGPVLHNPLRTAADVEKLVVRPAQETLWFTLDAVRITKAELTKRNIPLIGFSGAPFTLAAYAIEGGGSRNHVHVKSLMMGQPDVWDQLMTKFVDVISDYLLGQAAAGADTLQVFDSWVGQVAPDDFRKYVLPYTQQVIERIRPSGVPIIYFGTDTSGMLPDMKAAGSDVVGVDWRIDLDTAWDILGADVAVQGNLDPVALFAPWEDLQKRAQDILDRAKGRKGHVFNLGHGILPQTPVDNVRRLVDFVHEYTSR